ncbi:MAG: hypothetical protein WBA46_17740 [Thermomicrobiales bacterium]
MSKTTAPPEPFIKELRAVMKAMDKIAEEDEALLHRLRAIERIRLYGNFIIERIMQEGG